MPFFPQFSNLFVPPYIQPSGPTPINPDNIAGLTLWLKSDTGVTYDGSDYVSLWQDQSGNGNDATGNIDGGTAPIRTANVINGYPSIQFDKSGQFLSLASAIGGTEFTLLAVIRNNDASTGCMFFWTTDSNYGRYIGIITASSYNADGRNRVTFAQGDNGSGNSGVLAFSNGAANNNFIIASCKQNGGGFAYLNGSGGTLGVGSFSASNTFDLIGGYAYGYEIDGDVVEVIAYDTALSTSNQEGIEAYLNNKYLIY